MKKRVDHIILKTNHMQKRYIQHQLQYLNRIYKDMYKRVNNMGYQTQDIKVLFHSLHKYDSRLLEECEVNTLLHQLSKKEPLQTMTYCIISSYDMKWHQLSLKSLLPKTYYLPNIHKYSYAKLYMHKGQVHLDIYIEKDKKIEKAQNYYLKRIKNKQISEFSKMV